LVTREVRPQKSARVFPLFALTDSHGRSAGSIARETAELGVDTFTEEEFGRRIQRQAIEQRLHISDIGPAVFVGRSGAQEILHMLFFQFQIAYLVTRELRPQKSARVFPLFAVGGELYSRSMLVPVKFQRKHLQCHVQAKGKSLRCASFQDQSP
jgi:hypothetical protein